MLCLKNPQLLCFALSITKSQLPSRHKQREPAWGRTVHTAPAVASDCSFYILSVSKIVNRLAASRDPSTWAQHGVCWHPSRSLAARCFSDFWRGSSSSLSSSRVWVGSRPPSFKGDWHLLPGLPQSIPLEQAWTPTLSPLRPGCRLLPKLSLLGNLL